MKYLVIAVIDELAKCPDVLDAWEAAGIRGITILESTGLGRLRQHSPVRDDLPLMPSLRNLFQAREEHHRTLLAVVPSEEWIERIFEATEQAIGNLNEPNKGILFAVPVARAYGLLENDFTGTLE